MKKSNFINHKKTCVIYCRTATHKLNCPSNSVTKQKKICRKLAIHLGSSVVGVITDEGWGGSNLKRPGIKKLISLIKEFKPNYLIVTDIERLSRDIEDYIYLKNIFTQQGVQIKCRDQEIIDDPVMESILLGFSKFYSQYLSRKIKKGLQAKKEKIENDRRKN